MNLFGFQIRRVNKALQMPGGGWSVIQEPFAGAFEQGVTPLQRSQLHSVSAVYACVTFIANSISKLPLNQIELRDGVWQSVPITYDVLRRPSLIANRITWAFHLVACLLLKGSSTALKVPGLDGIQRLELFNPDHVQPLVSESGEAFFRLTGNAYSGLPEAQRTVPAEHVMHIPFNPLTHPLIGTSPLQAAIKSATSASAIMDAQQRGHGKKPAVYGFLKMPATLTDPQAAAAKLAWKESNGPNSAGVAVLRNGVEFEALQLTAKEAESVAALRLSNEDIARAFGLDPHLIGVGTIPSAANSEALMLQAYNKALHPTIELVELSIDEALDLPPNVGVEFDVSGLSRLDTIARAASTAVKLNSGQISINEARAIDGRAPVPGGELPRVQMQDVTLDGESDDTTTTETAGDNIQAEALNGAQVQSLQALIIAVASGELPAETARAAIAAAFPLLTAQQIDSMIGPLVGFTSSAKPDPAEPSELDDDDDDSEDEQKALRAAIEKAMAA